MHVTPSLPPVHPARSVWVVLLASAGDDGARLSGALARARRVVPDERIVVVAPHACDSVAHRCVGPRGRVRVVEQPAERGTTPGLLLALVEVLEEAPSPRVLVVPCTRDVPDDDRVVDALRSAAFALLEEPGILRVIGSYDDAHGVAADGWTLAATLMEHAPTWFGRLASAPRGPETRDSAFRELGASDFERDVLGQARAHSCEVPLRPSSEAVAPARRARAGAGEAVAG
jgi:hypothetical protein